MRPEQEIDHLTTWGQLSILTRQTCDYRSNNHVLGLSRMPMSFHPIWTYGRNFISVILSVLSNIYNLVWTSNCFAILTIWLWRSHSSPETSLLFDMYISLTQSWSRQILARWQSTSRRIGLKKFEDSNSASRQVYAYVMATVKICVRFPCRVEGNFQVISILIFKGTCGSDSHFYGGVDCLHVQKQLTLLIMLNWRELTKKAS